MRTDCVFLFSSVFNVPLLFPIWQMWCTETDGIAELKKISGQFRHMINSIRTAISETINGVKCVKQLLKSAFEIGSNKWKMVIFSDSFDVFTSNIFVCIVRYSIQHIYYNVSNYVYVLLLFIVWCPSLSFVCSICAHSTLYVWSLTITAFYTLIQANNNNNNISKEKKTKKDTHWLEEQQLCNLFETMCAYMLNGLDWMLLLVGILHQYIQLPARVMYETRRKSLELYEWIGFPCVVCMDVWQSPPNDCQRDERKRNTPKKNKTARTKNNNNNNWYDFFIVQTVRPQLYQ